jgi:4-hydroxy-tetrahydrodipicolinate synthase
MKDLSGVFTALVTPFRGGPAERPAIDEASLRRLTRQQIEGGVQGLVVAGTTAESPTLSNEERRLIFQIVKDEAAGRVPLMLGTGSNDTAQAVAWTREARELGADAALVVVPYYNKPPQRGIVAHYKAVAAAAPIPIVLYNVPSRTITGMDVETIAELSRVSNIVGVKEATGDLAFGARVIAACERDFLVTSGDDASAFELMLAGAKGVISVASHVLPEVFAGFCRRARNGDRTVSADYGKWLELVQYLYCEPNPMPVKEAMRQMGVIESAEMRLPLVPLAEPFALELGRQLRALGLVQ